MKYAYVAEGFLNHNTSTSRLSSNNPNAQNFPRKTGDPGEFHYNYGPKKLFTSRFGDGEGLIMQLDYSQLEIRLAAVFSEDDGLRNAYREGKDLHTVVASRVFQKTEDEVTKDERTKSKAVSFGQPKQAEVKPAS